MCGRGRQPDRLRICPFVIHVCRTWGLPELGARSVVRPRARPSPHGCGQGRRILVRTLSAARRQKPTDRRPTDRPAVPQPAGTQTISRPHTPADQTDRHADRTHGTGADTERRKTDEIRRVAGGRTEPSKTESRQKIGAKARRNVKNPQKHHST